jgi:hypothetical protein
MWAGGLYKTLELRGSNPHPSTLSKQMDNMMKTDTLDTKKITRVEIIDETGRSYVKRDISGLEVQLQDDGRTLKIFISKNNN